MITTFRYLALASLVLLGLTGCQSADTVARDACQNVPDQAYTECWRANMASQQYKAEAAGQALAGSLTVLSATYYRPQPAPVTCTPFGYSITCQ